MLLVLVVFIGVIVGVGILNILFVLMYWVLCIFRVIMKCVGGDG